ncbi:MAG: replication protein [Candidatus Eisenbacteria bacterium]
MSSQREKGQLKGGFVPWPNQVQDAALAFGFTKREGRVLQAIGRKTYGWRKKKDRVSYPQIAAMTGLHARNVAQVMRNLRRARVLTCEGDVRGGSVLIWGIQDQVELWDAKTLQRLRSSGRKKPSVGNGGLQDAGELGQPRVKIALPPRAKTALGTQGQNSPTQQTLLQTSLQTNRAADAAVSFSTQTEGREEGLLESQKAFSSEGKAARETGSAIPTQEQKYRIAALCAELEKADLNPYRWLARTNKTRTPIVIVIEVLEEAVEQRARIRDFWPWAEGVLRKICEREQIALVEREHEGRKHEFAERAGTILEQIMLRAELKERGEYRGNP